MRRLVAANGMKSKYRKNSVLIDHDQPIILPVAPCTLNHV